MEQDVSIRLARRDELTLRDLVVSIATEVYRRPYIAVGFTSWVIMFALALTSTTGMIRRLGGRRWQALHRLVYVGAVAGVVHYWWSVKETFATRECTPAW